MLVCAITVATSAHAADGIEKIAAYAGTWKIVIDHVATPYSKAGHEESTLRNDCWRSGGYFACNQYVNGESKVLLVFTYDAEADRYTSYPVPPDGSAAGKGVLEIHGNTWTYPWETKDGEKTTYFRVVNVFTAPDTIEFRQEFSTDKVTWTPMAHGREKKIAAGIVK
jgi:hypothetical protein